MKALTSTLILMTPNMQFTLAIVLIVWPLAFVSGIYCLREEKDKTVYVLSFGSTLITIAVLSVAWGLRLLWLWVNPPQML